MSVSAPQQQVLGLQEILQMRAVCAGSPPEDWLNTDISHLWSSPDMTDSLRLRFCEIQSLWDHPHPGNSEALYIYTDGSFKSAGSELTYVWVLLGHCCVGADEHWP